MSTSGQKNLGRTKMQSFFKFLEIPHDKRTTISVLRNPDLLPIPTEHQTWGFFSNFAYWGLLSFNIGTYSAASAASGIGMSYANIILSYFVGDCLTLCFTIANSFQGLNYKVGYTLTSRFVFGIYGSGLGILIRILMSIVNYSCNAFMGAYTVNLMIESIFPQYLNMKNTLDHNVAMNTRELIGFIIFHGVCVVAYFFKPYKMNYLLIWSSVASMASFVGLCIYLTHLAGGVGDGFKGSSQTIHGATFAQQFVYMASYWFGSVSPGTTNQSDYSRFAKKPWAMSLGIALGLLIPTNVVPIMGVVGTSAALKAFPGTTADDVWMPNQMCELILENTYTKGARAGVFFCGLSWTASQLAYNISSCGVPAGFDASGIAPRYINVFRGAMACALLSWACQPWNFYNSSSTFLTVMSAFGVIMTPILSIMICDNFCIRRQRYAVSEGFKVKGEFYFTKGVNWRAMFSWAAATAPGLPGLYYQIHPDQKHSPGIDNFFYANSFVAFLISFFSYWILCLIWPLKITIKQDSKDYYNAFTEAQALKKGMIPYSQLTEEDLNEVGLSKGEDSASTVTESDSETSKRESMVYGKDEETDVKKSDLETEESPESKKKSGIFSSTGFKWFR